MILENGNIIEAEFVDGSPEGLCRVVTAEGVKEGLFNDIMQ